MMLLSGANYSLYRLFLCILAVATFQGTECIGEQDDQVDGLIIAGYLPEYRSYINVNNSAPFLTDLILFSVAPDNQGKISSCCLESRHFEQARQARDHKKKSFPGTA